MTVMQLLLGCLVIVLVPNVAHGQWREASQANECAKQVEQRTAALLARDWLKLEVLATRYLQRCAAAVEPENLSEAHWSIAAAKMETGQYTEALRASDDCIGVFYSNASCHLSKAEALVGLKRFGEARTALEMTERLTEELLDNTERQLSTAKGQERELYQARAREFASVLRGAQHIRMQYFYLRDAAQSKSRAGC